MHRSKLVALGSPKELKEQVGAENLDRSSSTSPGARYRQGATTVTSREKGDGKTPRMSRGCGCPASWITPSISSRRCW
jgi:hypothetical protein